MRALRPLYKSSGVLVKCTIDISIRSNIRTLDQGTLVPIDEALYTEQGLEDELLYLLEHACVIMSESEVGLVLVWSPYILKPAWK